jgi:hypothetical protein
VPENPAGLVYGTILIATLLSAEYARQETYVTTIGAVLIALILYWLALAYSEFMGRRLQGGELFRWSAFVKAAKHESSVLVGAAVPLTVLVVFWIVGDSLGSAVEVAVYAAAAMIVIFELLAGYWSEGRGFEIAGHTAVGVVIGLLIIALRVVLH